MIIDSYQVASGAQRSYERVEYQSVGMQVWGGGKAATTGTQGDAVTMSLSELAQKALADSRAAQEKLRDAPGEKAAPMPEAAPQEARQTARAGSVGTGVRLPQNKEELKMQMLLQFFKAFTGKDHTVRLWNIFDTLNAQSLRSPQGGMAMPQSSGPSGGRIWATQFEYERESVSYQAQGVIHTADGKTISVDVSLAMSREYAAYSSTTLGWGQDRYCVDPLVINYGGNAASLTGEKFAFDLDCDGAMDNISFAGQGSGFLALDKNGDGIINNGSELFGPNTGNGFEELRSYDSDGNGWIDEADGIFSKLRIWSKDADGNDQLFTLQQLDIGAIYLGDVATEFSMTDAANNTHGIMRSTSFFLKESGGAGTINHIDLTV